jgi:hypothetical protein
LFDPGHRDEVIETLQSLAPAHPFSKGWLDDRDLNAYVRPRIERALFTGELVLVERAPMEGWKPLLQEPDEVEEPKAPEEPAPPKTWIEMVLQDADEEPLEGFRYRAVLTDGKVKEGKTDSDGKVRFEDIGAGIVQFRWVDLDGTTAVLDSETAPRTGQAPAVEMDFLEFQVVDQGGRGAPDRAWEATLPDGSKRSGRTGADGRVRLNAVPKGEVTLTFGEGEGSDSDAA